MAASGGKRRRASREPRVDYYTVLGVKRNASQEEIAEAYRERAKKYHPDFHPDDPNAEKQFLRLQAAFEVLSDPAKRAGYNRTRTSFATVRRPEAADHAWPVFSSALWRRRWKRDRRAVGLIRWPAICLLLAGLVGLPPGIYLSNLEIQPPAARLKAFGNPSEEWQYREINRLEFEVLLFTCNGFVRVALSLIAIAGAVSMLTLRIRSLAVIASLTAMLPYTGPCFGLGFPLGVWSLVRLNDATVKDAFWL
jgi:hypothetical protein